MYMSLLYVCISLFKSSAGYTLTFYLFIPVRPRKLSCVMRYVRCWSWLNDERACVLLQCFSPSVCFCVAVLSVSISLCSDRWCKNNRGRHKDETRRRWMNAAACLFILLKERGKMEMCFLGFGQYKLFLPLVFLTNTFGLNLSVLHFTKLSIFMPNSLSWQSGKASWWDSKL